MKRISIYFAVAATCLLAACAKTVEQSEPQSINVTYIRADGRETTKAAIDNDAAFTWSIGDQIAVYAGEYKLSDALSEGGAANATFAFSGANAVTEANRANFALFPARIASDMFGDPFTSNVTASSLDIRLPGEYNLSEIVGEKSPVPMIASNVPDGSLEFKQLGALLRLKLVNVPKQTEYITFDFNGKKVQGEFNLTGVTPGTTTISTVATDGDDDIVTVYNDGVFSSFQTNLIVNLPIPAGTYTDVIVTTWDGEPGNGGHKINALTTPINPAADWAAARKTARKREVILPVFTIDGNTTPGNGKKAVFAPGNLQAVIESVTTAGTPGTASKWQFAEHQYTALGNATENSLQSSAENDVIDLFAWTGASSTYSWTIDDEKYGIVYPSGFSAILGSGTNDSILLDWGNNLIDDGDGGTYDAGTWRLLTSTEWTRVIQQRKELGDGSWPLINHGAKATLTSGGSPVAYGLILLPDQFTYPAGVTELTKVFSQSQKNYNNTTCSDNSYSLEEWAKLEAAGCVFLPLTNIRTKGSVAETIYSGDAWYWSSTGHTTAANILAFAFNSLEAGASFYNKTTNGLQVNKSCGRQNGCAVRLVRQVN